MTVDAILVYNELLVLRGTALFFLSLPFVYYLKIVLMRIQFFSSKCLDVKIKPKKRFLWTQMCV